MYIEKSIIKITDWFTLFTLVTQANLVTLVTSHTSHPSNPTNTKVILVTKVTLVTIVIPVTKVALVILVTLVTKVTLVILVTLVTLVILVTLVTLVILQYRSKVSWHLILDPRENQESRLRIETWFSIAVPWFSIPARLIKMEQPLFTNVYKGFLFRVICSLLLILNCCRNLQSLFKFWAIF